MMCQATADSHCCHTPEGVCGYLDVSTIRCRLRSMLGSWDAVHASPEYRVSPVARFFDRTYPGFGCGDFPQNLNQPVGSRCCWENN